VARGPACLAPAPLRVIEERSVHQSGHLHLRYAPVC
jgi:hypothetical protein